MTAIVAPSVVATFDLGPLTSSVGAGTLTTFTITARDRFRNVATNYAGAPTILSSDPAATLPGPSALTGGIATGVPITFRTAGSQSIAANDGTITGSGNVSVTPGPAKRFILRGLPTSRIAGVAVSFGISALDDFGNLARAYGGLARITSSDLQAALPPLQAFTAGVLNGASITLKTAAASQTVIATDSIDASITGTSTLKIDPGPAFSFLLLDVPSSVTAGQAFSFRVHALDTFGNLATGYSGTAASSSSDGRAVLPGSLTFLAGQASASASLITAGRSSIGVADGLSLTGSASTTVQPSVATTFAITLPSVPVQAGSQTTFGATARDAFDNVATGYSGAPSITSSDAKAALPANPAFVAGLAADVPISFKTAGTQTVVATDSTVSHPVTGSSSISVKAGPASHYRIDGLPSFSTAGATVTFSLSAFDRFDNLATSYQGSAQVASSDPRAALPPSAAFLAGVSKTVSIVFETAAPVQSVTAADGTIAGAATLRVEPGPAATFAFKGPPTSVSVARPISFSIDALDQFANWLPSFCRHAHVTSSDAAAVLRRIRPSRTERLRPFWSSSILASSPATAAGVTGSSAIAVLPPQGTFGSAGISNPAATDLRLPCCSNGKVRSREARWEISQISPRTRIRAR